MSKHNTEITIDLPAFQFGVVASVTYHLYGAYAPATYHHPAEYPELEDRKLTSWLVDDDYRENRNADFDFAAVSKAIIDRLNKGEFDDALGAVALSDREGHDDRYAKADYLRDAMKDAKAEAGYDDFDDCPF